jgi:hypothetical protein
MGGHCDRLFFQISKLLKLETSPKVRRGLVSKSIERTKGERSSINSLTTIRPYWDLNLLWLSI